MPYSSKAKRLARAFVDRLRAATVCEVCGGKPIEWHHEDHVLNPNRRVARLTALGFPLPVIVAEIERCEAQCRRCHMRLDGRLAVLLESRPRQRGMVFPPKPCVHCGKLSKPLRRGLCNACNHKKRAGKL